MKTTYDIDSVVFRIIKESLSGTIKGGIYPGERPVNSNYEDITINTIVLSQDNPPQLGTSNINVHVPDLIVTVNNVQQNVEDRSRLNVLTGLVLSAIRSAIVPGLKIAVESQTTLNEPEIKQHYANIRINWNIH